MIHGPAHPENFRQQVGRYGDRHYVDNLPEDDIATESEALPSVSVVKSAFPKYLDRWAARQAAEYAFDNRAAWDGMERDEMLDLVSRAATRTRDRAANRGTRIHEIIMDICEGRPIDERLQPDDVKPFIPSAIKMVRDLRLHPEIVEAVVFHQTLGYGGTFDCIGDIVKGRYLLDYKTRMKADAYDEEAAQVAAYSMAEYMIVQDGNLAVRRFLPSLDGAAVVVLTPDGYRVHEVNMERASQLWRALLVFWRIKEPRGFYKGVMSVASQEVDTQIMQEALRQRVLGMPQAARDSLAARWPSGLPTLKTVGISEVDLMAIETLINNVERDFTLGFEPSAGKPEPPAEGDEIASDEYRAIMTRYRDLDEGIARAVDYYLKNTHPSIRMGSVYMRTVRRFEILRALIELAIHYEGDADAMARDVDLDKLSGWTLEHASEVATDYMTRRFGGVPS